MEGEKVQFRQRCETKINMALLFVVLRILMDSHTPILRLLHFSIYPKSIPSPHPLCLETETSLKIFALNLLVGSPLETKVKA